MNTELINKIRTEANKERVIETDCSIVRNTIESWWHNDEASSGSISDQIAHVQNILENELPLKEQDFYFGQVKDQNAHTAGVSLTGLFETPDAQLAYIVHEAICNVFHLQDIKFPHEEHKLIYARSMKQKVIEWSGGSGLISCHCDDLYEEIYIELLALTHAKDFTHTPTKLYQTKHILNHLSDEEVWQLLNMEAKFISGYNVSDEANFENTRKVLELHPEKGLILAFDYRKDPKVGPRMLVKTDSDRELLDKVWRNLESKEHYCNQAYPGTFTIISNRKALHGRGEIKNPKVIELTKEEEELEYTPDTADRLIIRSKGIRL